MGNKVGDKVGDKVGNKVGNKNFNISQIKVIIFLCIELKYNWCEIGTNSFT